MDVLPAVSALPALRYPYFPAAWQAVVWRNWGLAPAERIARVLGTSEAQVRAAAGQLGLEPELAANPAWLTRGYLTIIRENWHLCTFEQILALLDISAEKLAFLLKEDDFLWHKMGQIKPDVEAPAYRPLNAEEMAQTRELAAYLAAELPNAAQWRENAFAFVADLTRPLSKEEHAEAVCQVVPGDELRTVYSYFALYGDPLMNPELDPFPEALLAEYAKMGIKGVWMQGLLYQLVEFPFAPELSQGWQVRTANLKALVARAAQYGIGVYLYLNEPRAMNDAFFQRYPHLRGTREGDFYACCTSQPEVKAYLEGAVRRLFTAVPGLAGFFTITMSENLTNCYSRTGDGRLCPRCAQRNPWEVVAEVNNLMARGAHAANPQAKAIAWNWAWPAEWATRVPPLLSEGQIVQCTSETLLKTRIAGIAGEVQDYTMSLAGPGEQAQAVWRAALESGHAACAKVQFNVTWELSAVPWLPVFDSVARHVRNLQAAGVRHLQLSWTLGGYPSPNLKLAGYLMAGKGDVRDFMYAWLGAELGETAYQAQAAMSAAFSEFPFHIQTLYVGPQNYGPMVPFFLRPTGWKATMLGFPYDDLDGWRAIYPREVFERQFALLVQGWRAGAELMIAHRGSSPEFDDMARMAQAALCHFESTWNQIRFVMNRDTWLKNGSAQARDELLAIIAAEREVVLRAIALRGADSRIGYEASNHYYYTLQDLVEKLVNLRWCEERLITGG
ncbi:MAG: hypothetical protein LLG44_04320 [Chloroflexi bacterium]|nr:hypothetical protein [Chloroflexota bacterium]